MASRIGQEAGLTPKKSISVAAIFVFLCFILSIFVAFIFYLRFSSFSPMVGIYKNDNAIAKFDLNAFVNDQIRPENSLSKTVEIKITEAQLRETLNLSNQLLLDLKKPEVSISPDGIIIKGKTASGWFGINVEATVTPKVEKGKVAYSVKEVLAAGVTAPPKIADPLSSQINMLFQNAIPDSKNLTVTEVRTMQGFLLIEGTKK